MLNPIMLKELRQSVRNRLVTFSLIGFLGLLLIILSFLFRAYSSEIRSGDNDPIGPVVFGIVAGILALLELLAVPFLSFQRLCSEHGRGKTDLLFATPLPTAKVVDGKILAAMAMELLFLAAALPFLLLSYQLHGVALETILLYVAALLPAGACSTALGLLIGSFPIPSMARRMLYGLMLFSAIGPVIAAVVAFSSGEFLFANEWEPILLVSLLAGTVFLLVRAATVFALAPASTNRVRPFRVTVLAVLLLWAAALGATALYEKADEPLLVFFHGALLLLAALLVYAIAMPPGENRRTLLEIRPRRRPLQYLLSSATDGGIVLVLLLFGLVWAFCKTPSWNAAKSSFEAENLAILPAFLYFVSFAIVLRAGALLLPKFPRGTSLVLCSVLVPLAWSILTIIPASQKDSVCLIPGNLFAAFRKDAFEYHLLFSIAFVLIAVLVSLRRISRSYRDFRHP